MKDSSFEQSEIAHPLAQARKHSAKASLLPQLNHSTSNDKIEKRVNESNNNSASTITNRSESINVSNNMNDDNYSIIFECLNDRKTSAGKTSACKEPDPEEEKYWKTILRPHFNQMVELHKGMNKMME